MIISTDPNPPSCAAPGRIPPRHCWLSSAEGGWWCIPLVPSSHYKCSVGWLDGGSVGVAVAVTIYPASSHSSVPVIIISIVIVLVVVVSHTFYSDHRKGLVCWLVPSFLGCWMVVVVPSPILLPHQGTWSPSSPAFK